MFAIMTLSVHQLPNLKTLVNEFHEKFQEGDGKVLDSNLSI